MISRIYVAQKNKADFIDSYLITHKFSRDKLTKIGKALTNPTIEEFSIDKFPSAVLRARPKTESFRYAIEIGFKPGVTDNIGHTTEETICDLFEIKQTPDLAVYTSRIHLVSGSKNIAEAEKLALSLHNPLIERSYVASYGEIKKNGLPSKAPVVTLQKHTPVIKVPLSSKEPEELKTIGTMGIADEDCKRRGPLALDLASMKTIQAHFMELKREPTDIEIEALAQTWSEHCKHTIFANPIDDIKEGLYKTYIKGATNLIRKQKGKKDFCVSVFSDNSGGIIFDKNYLITHKVETHNSP